MAGKTGLSEGCADCYGQYTACYIDNCLSECVSNPTSIDCQICVIDNGCESDYVTCAGTPGSTACNQTCGVGEKCVNGQCVGGATDQCINNADAAILAGGDVMDKA